MSEHECKRQQHAEFAADEFSRDDLIEHLIHLYKRSDYLEEISRGAKEDGAPDHLLDLIELRSEGRFDFGTHHIMVPILVVGSEGDGSYLTGEEE